MKPSDYAILAVQWHMPRKYVEWGEGPEPPGGRFTIWSCCVPWPCLDYRDFYPDDIPEKYICSITVCSGKERRKISPEGKASIRRKRLERRIEKKAPLFAAEIIKKEMDSRPEYFDPEAIAQRDLEHARELKEYQEMKDMQWLD